MEQAPWSLFKLLRHFTCLLLLFIIIICESATPSKVNIQLNSVEGNVSCTSLVSGSHPHFEACDCDDEDCESTLLGFKSTHCHVSSVNCAHKVELTNCQNGSGGTTKTCSIKIDDKAKIIRCMIKVNNNQIMNNCDHAFIYVRLKKKDDDDSKTTIIVTCVVVGIVLLLVVVLLVRFCRQKFKKTKMLTEKEVYQFVNGNADASEEALMLPYNKNYEFPKSQLHLGKQLGGSASYGLFKARAVGIINREKETDVAVKTVHKSANIIYVQALITQLKIMTHIGRHINVLSLLGSVTENLNKPEFGGYMTAYAGASESERRCYGEVYLIVEYCRYGNVKDYIQKAAKSFVNQIDKGKIKPEIKINVPQEQIVTENCDRIQDQEERVMLQHGNALAVNLGDQNHSIKTTYASIDHDLDSEPKWRSNIQRDYSKYSKAREETIETLNTTDLIAISYQIAKGMEYLASKNVLHGDLSCRNLLLTDDRIVKIAEFGVARSFYSDVNYIKSQNRPPLKWMALETLKHLYDNPTNSVMFSVQTDVWSFAVCLWELFSLGDMPYRELGVQVDEKFIEKLEQGYRMKQPQYSTKEIYNIISSCWRVDPDSRPSFSTLGESLWNILREISTKDYSRLSSQ